MTRIHIQNGRVVDPASGFDAVTDLYLAEGRIAARGAAPDGFVADRTIDARDLVVCPGLIDLSARLAARLGTLESVESELAAAVAGGVTAIACPPDAAPVLDAPDRVERLIQRSAALGLARVYPLGALTQSLDGEKLAELAALAGAGCIAFSPVQPALPDTAVLLRALQYAATFGYTVRLQPQDRALVQGGVAHDGQVATRLGLPGIPVCAETVALATALQLARASGARLHFSRISSAAGIALLREARAAGLAVSCDVGIHHLHLTDMDVGFFDANARLDPPLRTASDRDALRAAAADGLAAICSDHSPVDTADKQRPFGEAAPGASALELLLPLTLKWATEMKLPLATALARITCDAAAVLGVEGGTLAVGAPADVCLFDAQDTWRVQPEALKSRGKNTPFLGYVMEGRAQATLVAGRVVFDALDR